MPQYQQTDTLAPSGVQAAGTGLAVASGADALLASIGGTTGTVTMQASASASGSSAVLMFEIDPDDALSWSSGDYVVRYNQRVSNSNLTWSHVYLVRMNSSGVAQATIASNTAVGVSLSTTGVKTTTLAGVPAVTANAGDRLYVVIGVTNTATMTQSFGTYSDQILDTPWASGAPSSITVTPTGVVSAEAVGSPTVGSDPMAPWETAVANRDTAPARALFIGDSRTEGEGAASVANRWQDILAAKIRAGYAVTGNPTYAPHNYVPIDYVAPTLTAGEWSNIVGATVANNFGLGTRVSIFNAAGEGALFTGTGTTFKIAYVRANVAASFTYSVDGGAPVTVSLSNVLTDGMTTDITGLSDAQHTIDVRWSSGGDFYLQGMYVYRGETAKGFQFFDGGKYGVASGNIQGAGDSYQTQVIQKVDPHLIWFGIGTNDYDQDILPATFKTNVKARLDAYRAGCSATPTIILTLDWQASGANTYAWSDYMTKLTELAAEDAGVITTYDIRPDYATVASDPNDWIAADGFHDTEAGHAKRADLYATFLGVPSGVAATTLSPTGIASGETVGSPAVTTGTLTATPTGIASAGALGSPTAVRGAITASPTGVASAESVGSPTATIAPASTTVSPTGITTAEAVGSPSVTRGTLTVSPAGFTDASAVGAPSVTLGSTTTSPVGVASQEALGSPTATVLAVGTTTVSPTGVGSAEAVGSPTVSRGALAASPTGISSAEQVGTPTVSPGSRTVGPTGIASAGAVGSPTVSAKLTVSLTGISSSEAVGSPSVTIAPGAPRTLSPAGIPSAAAIGSPLVRTQRRIFRTPTVEERTHGRPLRYGIAQGVTVLKVGGGYRQVRDPRPSEIDAASVVYRGGYEHELSNEEAADLEAAGYAAYFVYV